VERNSVRDKLEANRELAFMSRHIATIERNMPFLCDISDLKRSGFNNELLYELFRKLEFKSLIEKMNIKAPAPNEQKKETCCKVEILDIMSGTAALKKNIKNAGKMSIYYIMDKAGSPDGRLAGFLLQTDPDVGYFIRLDEGLSEEMFLYEFREIFENPKIKKTGHDMKTLIVYLKWKGIVFRGLAFDTMIAAYIINPSSESYNISRLASEHLGMSLEEPKDLAGRGKSYVPYRDISAGTLAASAAASCAAVDRLEGILGGIIRENNQEKLYQEIELPLIEVLADMEYRGFKVNVEGLRQFSQQLDAKIINITEEIYENAGEEFNINSPKQLGVILFDKLKLPAVKKNKDRVFH
jgi:DNA polymerase-1